MVAKVSCGLWSDLSRSNALLPIAQEEREYAIQSFKDYKKDVLVATDVASKGLDFPEIKHVINFDMPKEIEDYGKKRKKNR